SPAALGGIGTPDNFLEINVDVLNTGAPGVLRAYDTFATSTLGVFLTETSGDMKIDTVDTKGDTSLVTLAGSIVGARLGGAGDNTPLSLFNVRANNVWLDANGGSIGSGSTLMPDADRKSTRLNSSHQI